MRDVFLVDGIRTPVGRYGGSLALVRADDLAALPIRELLRRQSTLDPSAIEDVVLGCANQAGEDNRNVGRMASLLAGLPVSVAGSTVNRLCGSGMNAVAAAAHAIACNEGEVMIAGGVEHMTRAPFVIGKAETPFARSPEMFDTTLGWRFVNPALEKLYGTDSMGTTAENVAGEMKIPRDTQDRFAYRSHMKALAAQKSGRLAREIVPVELPQKKGEPLLFTNDETIRAETTLESLAKLKPAFSSSGSVTAGNSSSLNDGSCALLLASEDAVKRFQLRPRARFIGASVAGVEPRTMGLGPVPAVEKLLKRTGRKLDAIDLIELNEAFAAQVLGCLERLHLAADDSRLNPNGGAIALGHPLGMSGARLLLTALVELEARQLKTALCTMCIGVGQGIATLLERV